MKITREVEIKPFTVPSYVVVEDSDDTAIPLQELDPVALENLCYEFKNAVFEKAGKQQPPRPACSCERS